MCLRLVKTVLSWHAVRRPAPSGRGPVTAVLPRHAVRGLAPARRRADCNSADTGMGHAAIAIASRQSA